MCAHIPVHEPAQVLNQNNEDIQHVMTFMYEEEVLYFMEKLAFSPSEHSLNTNVALRFRFRSGDLIRQ